MRCCGELIPQIRYVGKLAISRLMCKRAALCARIEEIALTPREFDLLAFLAQHHNETVTPANDRARSVARTEPRDAA